MSSQTVVILVFSLLIAGKAIAIISIIMKKRRKGSTTHASSSPTSAQATPILCEMGPEVIVEDPMTQRLRSQGLLSLDGSNHSIIPVGEEERERDGSTAASADDVSTASRSVTDLTQPLPIYTFKDLHLEFANVPPPPSFSAVMASSKAEAKKKKRKNSTSTTVSTGSAGGESSSSPSTSTWPFWRTRRLSLPASSWSTAVPLPPAYSHQDEVGVQEQEQEQEQQPQQLHPLQRPLPVQQRRSSIGGDIFPTSTICPSFVVQL
ncbi:hypothetical protein EDD21DRAFT_124893 [Dissophora ornata]|nr:hypothetical protein EDD21DRAFT_124893 [Dissophora ornata]